MPFSQSTNLPVKKIEFEGGDVSVRAVSLQDVAILIDSHQFAITHIANIIATRKDMDFTQPEVLVDTIMTILGESPIMVANIIALCADDTDNIETAARLPLPVQLEILNAIGDLTFRDEAAIKKFAANVKTMIGQVLSATSTKAIAA